MSFRTVTLSIAFLSFFLLAGAPTHGAPRPMRSALAETTAAVLFVHILQRINPDQKKFLKSDKANKLFLGALDHSGKSVLRLDTLKKFRQQGFYAYPDRDIARLAPQQDYNYYQLSRPQQLSSDRIIWHCIQGRNNSDKIGIEDSSIESTFWMRKIGGKWRVEKSMITGGFY